MYQIKRQYTFCAGHRIEGHPKCGRLHGHNYVVEVELISVDFIDVSGMLLDYGKLDEVVKPIVDKLDHRYLVSESNKDAGDMYANLAIQNDHAYVLQERASTAECIAQHIQIAVKKGLADADYDHYIDEITVYVSESHRSLAMYAE